MTPGGANARSRLARIGVDASSPETAGLATGDLHSPVDTSCVAVPIGLVRGDCASWKRAGGHETGL